MCLDVDCFFAQVMIGANPSLKGKPVAIRQKYIVVTCTYEARALGVTKLMSIVKALELVPDLIIVDGSDLTPFRAGGRKLFEITRTTLGECVPIEKKGFDEVYVDITEPAHTLVLEKKREFTPLEFHGHVFGEQIGSLDLLKAASEVVAELRREILLQAGWTCSAGVSDSKFAAKIASNMNKPNQQTCFIPFGPLYRDYFRALRVTDLPGFGWACKRLFAEQGLSQSIITCENMLDHLNEDDLTRIFKGDRALATSILELAQGVDKRQVAHMSSVTKQISREETSLPHPTNMQDLRLRVSSLVDPLFDLVEERHDSTLEYPRTIRLSIKFRSENGRKSKSRTLPDQLDDMGVLGRVANELLNEFAAIEPFVASHVNLCCTDFTCPESASESRGLKRTSMKQYLHSTKRHET